MGLPLGLLIIETLLQRRLPRHDVRFLPLLPAGFGLYRFGGLYRRAHHAGAPGFNALPERILTTGPYAYSRNPMYLGHLIFTAGLALALRSPLAWLVFAARAAWFHRRVKLDEARLLPRFGKPYQAYLARVPRWLPGLF